MGVNSNKMAKKYMKWLWGTVAVLGIVGGLVHVLNALDINMLMMFGRATKVVQAIAGASGIAVAIKCLAK